MTYVVVVLETDSDTPGIAHVFGPYQTDGEGSQVRQVQRLTREIWRAEGHDPDLVQVAKVEPV